MPDGGNPCVWQTNTVRRIVNNPVYTGRVPAYRWKTEKRRKGKPITSERPQEEWIWLEGLAPAMVTEEEQQRAIQLVTAKKLEARRNTKNPEDALLRAGYARCAHCGTTLTLRNGHYTHNSTQRDRHGCPPISVSSKRLDDIVWDKIATFLLQPEVVVREITSVYDEADPHEMDEVSTKRRLDEVNRQLANYVRSLGQTDDDFLRETIMDAMKPIQEQKRGLEQDLVEIAAKRQAWEEGRKQIKDFTAICADLNTRIRTLTYEERRQALHTLRVRAFVQRDGLLRKVQVRFGLPFLDARIGQTVEPIVAT